MTNARHPSHNPSPENVLQDHLSYLQEAHLGRVRHAHRAGPRGRARRGPLRVQATLLDVLVHGELTGEKPAASADVRVSARLGGRSPRSASSEPARAPPMNRVPETRRSSGGDAMTMTARTRGSREDDETRITRHFYRRHLVPRRHAFRRRVSSFESRTVSSHQTVVITTYVPTRLP